MYWCERAWLGHGPVEKQVLLRVDAGRFVAVEPGWAAPPAQAVRLPGLSLPGLANCHSHAFHRALRGRIQVGGGSFWAWREQMYAVASRLDPDYYYQLARLVYAEMAATGITTVGEFHYLHHGEDGTPYSDPNAMGEALITAARDAGIRIALLDACYLTGGVGEPLRGTQQRFGDGDADAWAVRVDGLRRRHDAAADVLVGAAVHSVRAVPRDQIPTVAGWAGNAEAPLHVHLSEQHAENDACVDAYGMSPTQVLADAGALGPRSSAVHATHLTPADIAHLGETGTRACFCPTTERDLGDGIGPSVALRDAGASLTLGSDSHAVVDIFEEMRAVEMHERLSTHRRGHWTAERLLTAATATGHASLGFPDAGVVAPGAPADLVTLDMESPRTAGTGAALEAAVFAATAADVSHVLAAGHRVDRVDVGPPLSRLVQRLWDKS